MENSRAWAIWTISLCVGPCALVALIVAFDLGWLPPDRSGWTSRPFATLAAVQAAISLVAAMIPPRPARGCLYWPALAIVLALLWLTLMLLMAASFASARH